MVLDVGRVKHRADLMHKAIGSNGQAVPSNSRLATDGLKNVIWTPHDPGSGGGGSVSYGSNTMNVSSHSAGGAASEVSRSDHVHLGVRSVTANGSNSLFGNVNFQAGAGIGLGVAGQTVSIINIAGSTSSGGGGGSGAPTTSEYVVTAADAGLSAERVMDLGAYGLLKRRVVANTEDDHFTAGTLDAKWLAYTGADPTTDLTLLESWCKLTSTGYKLQAVPAGDWSLEIEVIHPGYTAAGFQNAGIIVSNGSTQASATDIRLGLGNINDTLTQRIVFEKFVNGGFNTTFASVNANAPTDHLYLKLTKAGTSYQPFWSTTGVTWMAMTVSTASGITATHLGFGGTTGAYFNYFVRY